MPCEDCSFISKFAVSGIEEKGKKIPGTETAAPSLYFLCTYMEGRRLQYIQGPGGPIPLASLLPEGGVPSSYNIHTIRTTSLQYTRFKYDLVEEKFCWNII
jgi:hypothetical protein